MIIYCDLGDRTNRSLTSLFLVSLAIADLLFITISAPWQIAEYFIIEWNRKIVCKLGVYIENVSVSASVLNLLAVTFER